MPSGTRVIAQRVGYILAAALLTVASVRLLGLTTATPAQALSNGLALSPPMGWNEWNAFGCNVNEQLVEQTADAIVNSGMKGRRIPVRQHR